MSNYPTTLDTDLELPQISSNVTEIGGDAINALRDSIFAIQKTLGINPQGNLASLATRLNVSIDANGLIKQSALESRGLVTLPVVDAHIGVTAAIVETKLDLDFSTQSLRNSVVSVQSDLDSILSSISAINHSLTQHISGASRNHDGYQVLINLPTAAVQYGVAGLSATTVGGAINEFATILLAGNGTTLPHVDLELPSTVKHIASRISVDTTNFVNIDPTVENVQEALDDIDSGTVLSKVAHLDNFHSNGIFREINSGTYYNSNQPRLLNASISYTEGSSVVSVSGLGQSLYTIGQYQPPRLWVGCQI